MRKFVQVTVLALVLLTASSTVAAQPTDDSPSDTPGDVKPTGPTDKPDSIPGGVGKAITQLPGQASQTAVDVLNTVKVNDGQGLGEALSQLLGGNERPENATEDQEQ